jgi:mannose-6-phosphate isomerase-like protein (cupin superfamily)
LQNIACGPLPRQERFRRGRVFKILHLDECPASPMEPGRGEQIKLINPGLGTEKVDVHLNRLVPGGPGGKVHHHTEADNVYIVKRGEGTLTVEGKTYLIRENDVVYIPAGMKHALANRGSELFEIFEIYAPSGRHSISSSTSERVAESIAHGKKCRQRRMPYGGA